jgi:hypothetical protein
MYEYLHFKRARIYWHKPIPPSAFVLVHLSAGAHMDGFRLIDDVQHNLIILRHSFNAVDLEEAWFNEFHFAHTW